MTVEPTAVPSDRDDDLERLLVRAVEAAERGDRAEIERILVAHPTHAEAIRKHLTHLDDLGLMSAKGRDAPEQIGPYRILDVLGEGGMGTVYLAEQKQPVRRRVALKIIKLGMDSKQVLARFEAERQALAMMNHDNIAKVLEAGTTERGQPFFVMEHVAGLPITQHCDQERLTMRQRLALFQQVCAGVQHAHQKGVIHRDLKPSNVLVTVDQGKAVPKIIDFGLARATDHRLVEATLFTEQGVILGTPEYMSPEQAEMSSQDIDTRTDVYSLGVLLYELLVGTLPFSRKELRSAGFQEIQRRIREDDPPKPSTKLASSAELSMDTAARRRTNLATLLRELRGDLDWIVLRAMEKERNRRYATAAALAADVQCHLDDEPVVARPPSALYRFGKVVRRYRAAALGAAAVFVALLAGLVVSWQLYRQSEANAARAEQNEDVAKVERDAKAALLLAHQSATVLADEPILALLLAIEGASLRQTYETNNALWTALEASPVDTPTLTYEPGRSLATASLSPDGRLVGVTLPDGRARILGARSGDLRQEFGDRAIGGIAFSAESDRFAMALDHTGAVHVFDAASGDEIARCAGKAVGGSPSFSPCGRYVAFRALRKDRSSSYVEELVVCDAANGEERGRFGHGETLFLAFDHEGVRVACAAEDHAVEVRNLRDGRLVATLSGHEAPVHDARFAPDGRTLATVSADRTVRLWDVASGQERYEPRSHEGMSHSVCFSSDGRLLLTSGGQTLHLWNTATGAPRVALPFGDAALAALFGADRTGVRVLVAGSDGGATLRAVPLDLLAEARRRVPRALTHVERVRFGVLRPEDEEAARLLGQIREPGDLVEDVERRLAARDDLSVDTRARVRTLARERGDPSPGALNERAWRLACRPDRTPGDYAAALRMAETACRREPDNAAFLNTLGVARYRAGRDEEALAALARSDKIRLAVDGIAAAEDVAFQAMALYRLGRTSEAETKRATLRRLVNSAENVEARRFLAEVEAVLGGGR